MQSGEAESGRGVIQVSSLPEMLVRHAQRRAEHPAVVLASDAQERAPELSFEALYRESAALAAQLAERAPPGERALLLFPTGLEFVVSYFACLMAGLVAVPLMPPRRTARADASAAIIADCSPRLVLTPGGEWGGLQPAFLTHLAGLGIEHVSVVLGGAAPSMPPQRRLGSDTLAFLQYTSGSTRVPHGVMVTHGNLLANLSMMQQRLNADAGFRHVSWVPLYHDMGLIMNLLLPLFCGGTSVLMSPSGFMHRPLGWLRSIARFEAQAATAPNFAYDLCVDRFRADQMEGVDLGAWRMAINGAEPLRAATLQRFAACFQPYGFRAGSLHPSYGLAEATLMVSSAAPCEGAVLRGASIESLRAREIAPPRSEDDTAQMVSCGPALDGIEIAIVDPETRQRLPQAKAGEIWLRGASIAQGYWGRAAESDQVFRAAIAGEATAPGWLRTGDLGDLDAEGRLFVVGRLKDVLIIRGVNHYPQDLEATAAAAHPALRRDHGAVFAVPDGTGGERIVLVQEVERTQRHALDRAAVEAAIRAAIVENHEVAMSRIALIRPGTLPKTTSGKVQRFRARQLWLDDALELLDMSLAVS